IFQAEDDIRNRERSRGLGVYKRQKIYFIAIILSDIFGVKAYPAINKKDGVWGYSPISVEH
ncbi:hypothetical protein, partial [Campylobacter concisus]|uniref:hypothetical protein n=1 Tax=Campylobacter concisus TaxID=199 RepID=UPI001CA4A88F